jgi:hypothetical protein
MISQQMRRVSHFLPPNRSQRCREEGLVSPQKPGMCTYPALTSHLPRVFKAQAKECVLLKAHAFKVVHNYGPWGLPHDTAAGYSRGTVVYSHHMGHFPAASHFSLCFFRVIFAPSGGTHVKGVNLKTQKAVSPLRFVDLGITIIFVVYKSR